MDKKYQSITSTVFNITTLMSHYELTMVSELDDAIFLAKVKKSDNDEDSVCNKTLKTSGVTVEENFDANGVIIPFALIVDFELADYGEGLLESGKRYFMGVGIKRLSPLDTCFLEGELSDEKLNITPDTIRC